MRNNFERKAHLAIDAETLSMAKMLSFQMKCPHI
jgi:hypothetical protein